MLLLWLRCSSGSGMNHITAHTRKRRIITTTMLAIGCSIVIHAVTATITPIQLHESDVDDPLHVHDSAVTITEAPHRLRFKGADYIRSDLVEDGSEALLAPYSMSWVAFVFGTVGCVILAALAAGLTVG